MVVNEDTDTLPIDVYRGYILLTIIAINRIKCECLITTENRKKINPTTATESKRDQLVNVVTHSSIQSSISMFTLANRPIKILSQT